jgi:DNA invertase Pin-like site-specific DNA recombinase
MTPATKTGSMAKTKRAALYLRVSTDGQSVENQRLALPSCRRPARLERGGRVL